MKNLKNLRRRGLALLVVLTLCLGMLPFPAAASEARTHPVFGTELTAERLWALAKDQADGSGPARVSMEDLFRAVL